MKFDHQRAVSLHAVERCLLGELDSPLREEFEDHFFECPECAEALRAGLILQQNGRALLRAEPHLAAAVDVFGAQADVRPGPGVWWRAWLRIPSLVPLAAALLLSVLLWNQGLERTGTNGLPVVSVSTIRIAAPSRNAAEPVVLFSGNLQTITLDVKTTGSYFWILRRTAQNGGGTAFQGTGDAQHGELTFILDTRKLDSGDYEIAVRPAGESSPDEKLYQFTLKRTH